jgi:uncharacterized protein (TIGR02186 family)
MIRKRVAKWHFHLVLILSAVCATAVAGENPGSLTIVPDQIKIGAFYHGAKVQVSANVASCDGAVIVLEGDSEKVTLNRKGRVAIVWMNVAKITVSGLPQVYILASTTDLDDICSKDVREELRLGADSFRIPVKIDSDKPLTGDEFDWFLKLKVRNGTYNTKNKIELIPKRTGEVELSSTLPIPSKMPPGVYDIILYCFRQGNMVEMETARLKIDRIGLPHLIRNLADKHAAMYGLLAIVAAMVFGVVMGIVFSLLPGGRRRY